MQLAVREPRGGKFKEFPVPENLVNLVAMHLSALPMAPGPSSILSHLLFRPASLPYLLNSFDY